jgi:hypothetical protein
MLGLLTADDDGRDQERKKSANESHVYTSWRKAGEVYLGVVAAIKLR